MSDPPSDQEKHPIGIDLGTTWCAVAHIDETGKTAIVPNREGEIFTPSVVLFDEGDIIVGEEARKAIDTESDKVAECAKRDMGQKFMSHDVEGKKLPPGEVQAHILRKLKDDTVAALGKDVRAVITVPAFFDDVRRSATADAGVLAGIEVIDIINEPMAAALAYGETLGYLSNTTGVTQKFSLLVYDLGGGTFDVTVMELGPGKFRTQASRGAARLGGRDWDLRLAEYAAEDFRKHFGGDPLKTPGSFFPLMRAAEDAKRTLSSRKRAVIKFGHDGHMHEVPVTRQQFEELTDDLLERTSFTTQAALKEAKLDWTDLNGVLLVGGSSKMPMVVKMLTDLADTPPIKIANPDEVVARGAAIFARHKSVFESHTSDAHRDPLEIIDVSSYTLGAKAHDPKTNRSTNAHIIPRGSTLPASGTRVFRTSGKDFSGLGFDIYEGESDHPEDCSRAGRAVLREFPPNLPKGTSVTVTYHYEENGRLKVWCEIADRRYDMDIERAGPPAP